MRDCSADHRGLSINTATVRQRQGRDWPPPDILDGCTARGIWAVAPWRDQVAAAGLAHAARTLRALDEACELDAACLVLVGGGLPGALAGRAAHQDISGARAQVTEGIARLLDAARERRMPLAIEPLHPKYAADRGCVHTLSQALLVGDALDPQRASAASAQNRLPISHTGTYSTPSSSSASVPLKTNFSAL